MRVIVPLPADPGVFLQMGSALACSSSSPAIPRKGDTDPPEAPADACGHLLWEHRLPTCDGKVDTPPKTERLTLEKAMSFPPRVF